MRYVARVGREAEELGQEPIEAREMGLINLEGVLSGADDLDALASAMNATALQSRRFRGHPVYQFTAK